MSANINLVILTGRVGQDPDYRKFNSGDEVIEFSLATSEYWTDKRGDRQQKTQWHRIKLLGEHSVKIGRQYVKKGDLVGIEGELQYRQWEKDGVKHTMAEVVVGPFRGRIRLGPKSESGGGDRDDDRGRSRDRDRDDRRRDDSRGRDRDRSSRRSSEDELDDSIPF